MKKKIEKLGIKLTNEKYMYLQRTSNDVFIIRHTGGYHEK